MMPRASMSLVEPNPATCFRPARTREPEPQICRPLLEQLVVCRGIEATAMQALASGSTLRALSSGEPLAFRSDPLNRVYGICEGYVKSEVVSEDGDRFLVDVSGPGDTVCLAAFLRAEATPYDLRAEGNARVLVISGRILDRVLDASPRLSRNVAILLASSYERALEQVQTQGFMDAESALALRVSRLIDRHGTPHPSGGRTLPFRLSQEDLGASIGCTREAVGRVLRRWEQKAWVELGYARLVVRNPEALESCFECSDDLAVLSAQSSLPRLRPEAPR